MLGFQWLCYPDVRRPYNTNAACWYGNGAIWRIRWIDLCGSRDIAVPAITIALFFNWFSSAGLCAFSALTLLVGCQEVMRCWCGYLSGARCRLFAYGPADATASPNPIISCLVLNPDWFYLSGTGLPRLSWKRGCWTGVVMVVVVVAGLWLIDWSMYQ